MLREATDQRFLSFRVITLGCKVNRIEADTMRATLRAAGFEEVFDKGAHLCLIHTCTVTAEADAKVRKAIRRAAAEAAAPTVIVTGCAAALWADELTSLAANVRVIANYQLALNAVLSEFGRSLPCSREPQAAKDTDRAYVASRFLPYSRALQGEEVCENAQESVSREGPLLIEPCAGGGPMSVSTTSRPSAVGPCAREAPTPAPLPVVPLPIGSRVGEGFRARVGIKIQDGCSNCCSYCIVPAARGAARSRPFAAIRAEAEQLLVAGARELVISGINVGAYSDGGRDLVDILSGLSALPGRFRLRLSSIEPERVSERLLELIARDQRICRHLHIPLQSGSSRVLAAMRRCYTAEGYLKLVARARAAVKGLALTSDCIVGFPQEDEEDFEETLAVVLQARFAGLHVFRYSSRPGTPAACLSQVSPELRAKRAGRLRALAKRLAATDRQWRVDDVEQVVMEDAFVGRGESYHRVRLAVAQEPGALLAVRYTGCSGSNLLAECSCPGN